MGTQCMLIRSTRDGWMYCTVAIKPHGRHFNTETHLKRCNHKTIEHNNEFYDMADMAKSNKPENDLVNRR